MSENRMATTEKRSALGIHILRLLLLLSNLLLQLGIAAGFSEDGLESERLALLDFKNGITRDPFRVLSSWNESTHYCKWAGVFCSSSSSSSSNHQQNVLMLFLENQQLMGNLSPSIGNLTSLTAINLRNNFFHGQIPQEIGRLSKLQHLNLTRNSFTGEIPTNLSQCTDLKIVDFVSNSLVGSIPDQLSSLKNLVYLKLDKNNLTGTIPSWFGNFSSLLVLSLIENNLQGEIPEEIGGLSKLGFFQVYDNKLFGTIPSSIYNISSLYIFSLTANQFHGSLPSDLGFTLPNLRVFAGGVNNFTGSIPISLANSSGLKLLDFAENHLTGAVPTNLGSLQSLIRLNFGSNQLGFRKTGDLNIITALANCTDLEVLGLDDNNLGGELPESIANLSTHLTVLTIGRNRIHGVVSAGIENLVDLNLLGLEDNLLTGNVPFVIGKLQELYLNGNRFSGLIPSSIGNLSLLNSLFMEMNSFEGSIPSSLGNCQNLIVLSLPHNKLNGSIPRQIFNLTSLSIYLSMGHNSLSGSLPFEVGSLRILGALDLSNNKLSGEIPSTLGNIISLERLYLGSNFFQGAIPQSLSSLRGIQLLDLSSNKLSGRIPDYLEKLPSLKYLNLSFNDFSGEVPKEGVFADTRGFSVVGNNMQLCGGIRKLNLPACLLKPIHKSRRNVHLSLKVIVLAVFGCSFVFLLSVLATYCLVRKLSNRSGTGAAASTSEDAISSVSYAQLFKSTDGFSKDNLIGVGSFGSVYKGKLHISSASEVAVKVLNLQQVGASKSFISECEALKNIRHRNLVKILTACSSVDSKGNDFKALVFELMSNGNLDQWLHPQVSGKEHFNKSLNLRQRLNIAIDVASALEYLHHDCEIPIAHCDLKPSNVLLNDDMTAHVGDFGLARFLLERATDDSSTNLSVGLKGSIGYIPPEYGMGSQVSIYGDIYSYGILLLEMVTGRRPTDDMFKDGLYFHNFAATGLPDRVMEIADPLLFLPVSEEQQERGTNATDMGKYAGAKMNAASCSRFMHECLVSVIRIGISCSMPSPADRMVMKDVVSQLQDIRKFFESHYR